MASEMKTGKLGIALIKAFEGLRLTAYLCPAGIWTIGYGHTEGVTSSSVISADMAERYLEIDLAWAEKVVNTYVKIKLNQNQFDSLVSFVFNLGGGAFRKSLMLKRINEGKFDEAMTELLEFHHINHVDNAGLKRRRKAETELFMKPIT
jgi:lysozyme